MSGVATGTARTTRPDVLRRFARLLRTAPVILGSLGCLLSAAGSWIPSLWGDEVTSALSAERPLPSLFVMLGHVDAVHGTYYLGMHAWVDLFGASPFALRFPSAVAAGIAVAGVTVLGRLLADARTGVFAGAICLVLPRLTYAGEEARSYAVSAACAVWISILLVHLAKRPEVSRQWWTLYAVGVAICAYVFLFSLLLLVAHAAVALALRRRDWLKGWAIAAATGLCLALPVIAYGIAERGQIAFLAARSAAKFSDVFYGPWFGNLACGIVAWTLIAAAIILPTASWIRDRNSVPRRSPIGFILAAAWTGGPIALLLLINSADPIYSSRYLTFCVPGVALLLGLFLARVRYRRLAIVAVGVLAATASTSYVHDRTPYAKNSSDWAEDAAVIREYARPGQAILFDEATRPSLRPRLAMRGYPDAFRGLKDVALRRPWYETTGWRDSVYPLDDVIPRLDDVDAVWLLDYKPASGVADSYDEATLESDGYQPVRVFTTYRTQITEFRR